jgi:hypothetical protein
MTSPSMAGMVPGNLARITADGGENDHLILPVKPGN